VLLRVLEILAIGWSTLALFGAVSRRERRWPGKGHGPTFFTTSSETKMRE